MRARGRAWPHRTRLRVHLPPAVRLSTSHFGVVLTRIEAELRRGVGHVCVRRPRASSTGSSSRFQQTPSHSNLTLRPRSPTNTCTSPTAGAAGKPIPATSAIRFSLRSGKDARPVLATQSFLPLCHPSTTLASTSLLPRPGGHPTRSQQAYAKSRRKSVLLACLLACFPLCPSTTLASLADSQQIRACPSVTCLASQSAPQLEVDYTHDMTTKSPPNTTNSLEDRSSLWMRTQSLQNSNTPSVGRQQVRRSGAIWPLTPPQLPPVQPER